MTAVTTAPLDGRGAPRARRRGAFHPLTVASVDRLTDDAVAVTFDVPPDLAEEFRFEQGQHLTVRYRVDGTEVRRNYSICAPAPDGPLRIGVKRLPGGAFSEFANGGLSPGDVLEVMPPLGRFNVELTPHTARTHVAMAAGSGITPVLSLIATTLRREPDSSFALVYANRTARDVMFLDELSDLKDTYPSRFQLLNVLSREEGEAPLTSGRIDAPKLDALLSVLTPAAEVDHWYLCGPFDLVDTVRGDLAARGVPEDRVHFELFHVEDTAPVRRPRPAAEAPASSLTFTLDGRTSTAPASPDEPLLTTALRTRPDAPYACRGGVCGTCRALLCSGTVDMPRNFALEPSETRAGYILTCQSTPTTAEVTVDYDA